MRPVVVFGASGNLGRVVARALVRRGVPTVLAGRDAAKLAALADALGGGLEVRLADATDPASLRAMLEGAGAVVSTVGPFVRVGEALVEAAIEAGVHYVDTSVEQVFEAAMRERHHAKARRVGVAVLTGQGGPFAFGALGAALLAERFGPLSRFESHYDFGAFEPSRGAAKSLVAMLGAEARTFEAGRFVPLAPARMPRRTALPGYDEPAYTVPFAGGDVALLPHEMPSLRAASSHLVLPRAGAHGAAIGLAWREIVRPLLWPGVVELLERAVDRGLEAAHDEHRPDDPFRVVVLATSGGSRHAFALSGPSLREAAGELAALAASSLAEGRARAGGVSTVGAALDAEALLEALRPTFARWSVTSAARDEAPVGKHEVQTTAIANAPADEVWKRLLETNAWGRWSDALGLRGDIREGERVMLVLATPHGPKVEIPVRVEAVEPGRELRWSGGVLPILRGTHYFRLDPIDDKRTRITHGERFEGPMAAVSFPFLAEPLRERYQRITDRLAEQFR